MKPTRIHLEIILVVAVAGLLWWQQGHDEEQTSASPVAPTPAATQSDSADKLGNLALRHEVARLRAEMSELRDSAHTSARERAPEEPTQQARKTTKDPYSALEPFERDAAIAGDLREAMNAEPVDESWRDQTEATFHSAVAEIAGADTVAVECRSTLCRVELAHATADERTRATDALTTKIPWDASGYVQMVPSDPPTSVIYIARAGHELPRAPAR